MALYNVKLRVEYTVDIFVEGVESAEEAKRAAALSAATAVERAFEESLSTIGESKALSAVCVNSLE